MSGSALEIRAGDGVGRVILRKPLAFATTAAGAAASAGSPLLHWIGNDHIVYGQPTATPPAYGATPRVPRLVVDGGFDLRTGRSWSPPTTVWLTDTCSCVSPDGQLIAAAVQTRPGDHFAIGVSRPNRTGLRTLNTVPGCLFKGSFSPAVPTPVEFAGDDSLVYGTSC